jgi:hypothetical protein
VGVAAPGTGRRGPRRLFRRAARPAQAFSAGGAASLLKMPGRRVPTRKMSATKGTVHARPAGGPKRCRVCGALSGNSCFGCRAARYCTRACQKRDWAAHKRSCARLPAALRRILLAPLPPPALAAEASPLCLKAEAAKVGLAHGGRREGFFRHPASARRRLGPFLQELADSQEGGGGLRVDDALFVQLVLLAGGEGEGAPAGPVYFAVGRWAPWLLFERGLGPGGPEEGGAPARGGGGERAPGYYAPKDPTVAELMQRAPSGGGMWLLGPDERGRYLGLGPSGAARRPLPEWHAELLERFRAEIPGLPPASRAAAAFMAMDDLGPDRFRVHRGPRWAEGGRSETRPRAD